MGMAVLSRADLCSPLLNSQFPVMPSTVPNSPRLFGCWGSMERKTGLRNNHLQFQIVTRTLSICILGGAQCVSATLQAYL
jgi:hypothetical protein